MKKLLLITLFLLIQPFITYGADTVPQLPPNYLEEEMAKGAEYNSTRYFKEFLNMVFLLGLIIATLFLILHFFKRYMHTRTQQMNEQSDIKLVEQRALSAKSSLYVIEFAGQTLLIAESPAGVQLLTKGAPFSLEK